MIGQIGFSGVSCFAVAALETFERILSKKGRTHFTYLENGNFPIWWFSKFGGYKAYNSNVPFNCEWRQVQANWVAFFFSFDESQTSIFKFTTCTEQ